MREDYASDRKKATSAGIVLTTGTEIPARQISGIIDIVGGEAALGMSIVKDIMNNWRDFVGGRSATVQNMLKEAREHCLQELRQAAYQLGAEAVVSIKIDYSEVSTNNGGILFVAATGTAVKLAVPAN